MHAGTACKLFLTQRASQLFGRMMIMINTGPLHEDYYNVLNSHQCKTHNTKS